jgi:DegV family protein with EDD domain
MDPGRKRAADLVRRRPATTPFGAAYAAGYARLSAWSDLLDEINVFPVADGDTGRNLCISLSPLREMAVHATDAVGDRLIRTATGNSGNIAAAFLAAFLTADTPAQMAAAAAAGARKAREAVGNPVGGTMLDIFDTLAHQLAHANGRDPLLAERLLPALVQAVLATMERLPVLARAKLIDAGALAMYLFFEGFFNEMAGRPLPAGRLPAAFRGLTRRRIPTQRPEPAEEAAQEICVNALVTPAPHTDIPSLKRRLSRTGESVVVLGDAQALKVHLHAGDLAAATDLLAGLGTIEAIRGEALYDAVPVNTPLEPGPIHIMTDAAGSLSRDLARQLGVTLLDSFVVAPGGAVPETLLEPEQVYRRMRAGERVSTAQAANAERHQRYAAALERFNKVLYLGVGSAYTGNVAAARQWGRANDPDGRLTVMDTGAASGKLGLIALATARMASRAATADPVIRFAEDAAAACGELVFLDQLKYLAAGGRISKTGGFFGDLLRLRPVISPRPGGVEKVAVVRRADEQLPLALKHLLSALKDAPAPLVLLQYTDNQERVAAEIRPALEAHFPSAEIITAPLSLTAGVHMGPGTWAVAWLRDGGGKS